MPITGPLPMLKFGSYGEAVRLLQQVLNLAPTTLARLAEDAAFGLKTKGRVQEFQSRLNLDADGVVGPLTWGELQPWLELLAKVVDNPVSPGDEAAARARICQQAEACLSMYGWGATLPKEKFGRVDRDALKANPHRIAAAYCYDASNPLRPRAGGASLALIFNGAGGAAASKAINCMTISVKTEATYQLSSGKTKTDTLNKEDIGSWCGVFATFVYRTAGLWLPGWPLRTRPQKSDADVSGFDFQSVSVTGDVREGDLGIYGYGVGESNHHFIVVNVEGSTVHTIDGNVGDPNPGVVAPWSSVVGRRKYTRVDATTLRTATGKTSKTCYFMRPIWQNVLRKS